MEFAYTELKRIDGRSAGNRFRELLGKNIVMNAYCNGESVVMFTNGRLVVTDNGEPEMGVSEYLAVDYSKISMVYCDRNGEVTLHIDPVTEVVLDFLSAEDGPEVCRIVGMSKMDYPLI